MNTANKNNKVMMIIIIIIIIMIIRIMTHLQAVPIVARAKRVVVNLTHARHVSCQKAHRSHKTECRRRAADTHDENLFKQPPQPEDCPICSLLLPSMRTGTRSRYQSCCGIRICSGCIRAGASHCHHGG